MVGWHGFGLANLVRSMPSAELRVGSAVVSSAVSLAVCAGSPSTATSTSSYDVTCSLCPSDLDALLLLLGMFGVALGSRASSKLARGCNERREINRTRCKCWHMDMDWYEA